MRFRIWESYPSYVFPKKEHCFNAKEENFKSHRACAEAGFAPCLYNQRARQGPERRAQLALLLLQPDNPCPWPHRPLLHLICWHGDCRAFLRPPCVKMTGSMEVWIQTLPQLCPFRLTIPQFILLHCCNTLCTVSSFHGVCFCHILANRCQTMLSWPLFVKLLSLVSSSSHLTEHGVAVLQSVSPRLTWLRRSDEHKFSDEQTARHTAEKPLKPSSEFVWKARGLKKLFLECRLSMNALSLFSSSNNHLRHSNYGSISLNIILATKLLNVLSY